MTPSLDTMLHSALTWQTACRADGQRCYLAEDIQRTQVWFTREQLRTYDIALEQILSYVLYSVINEDPSYSAVHRLPKAISGSYIRMAWELHNNRLLRIPNSALLDPAWRYTETCIVVQDIHEITAMSSPDSASRGLLLQGDLFRATERPGIPAVIDHKVLAPGVELDYDWLEANYPGGFDRLNIGIELGLSGSLLLSYGLFDAPVATPSTHAVLPMEGLGDHASASTKRTAGNTPLYTNQDLLA